MCLWSRPSVQGVDGLLHVIHVNLLNICNFAHALQHWLNLIARSLSLRPEVKYMPVFMTGMGRSLPKGKMILLPYKASIYYGMPALVKSTDTHEILDQITGDFEAMKEKYQVIIDEEEE